ncbi:GNAT family N-acetyltransferase [Chryseobacterium sp. Ch-15]|uniref:GNAT family N-acetyltransferase n=1 Tax=Chryseobacterium muglaense TaxID=2893752 RepID=A0A9Q3UZD9_9FLAO|nr:GNAT family protein [Chryseobacterium muglaense]MBD3906468.1 GNAT family N-acetyltransferase [Chryseobacterium muglaense]MCC9036821.1 GNAT family N-acetyltransferase [Chryseobacterium muglaense]MCM2556147.1 GNAT family N-acetyltransferase [Chryseobacterium muglaense]
MEFFSTDRLIIRSFRESDATDLFAYFSAPRVNCFADEQLTTLEEAVKDAGEKSKDQSQFAVCLKDNDLLIGNLFAMQEEDTFNVGWNFNGRYEGKGYAREAAAGLFDYLFVQKEGRRIYCYVEDYNTRSQKLCERLGMRKEGLFMEYISFVKNDDGTPRYENTLQFAILKKEWKKLNDVI